MSALYLPGCACGRCRYGSTHTKEFVEMPPRFDIAETGVAWGMVMAIIGAIVFWMLIGAGIALLVTS